MTTWPAGKAGLTRPLPEDWDEDRVQAALFGSALRQAERAIPDFAALDEQRQKNKHVTRQLLWEEYREANPDGTSD